MHRRLVSVITPAFNAASTVGEAIDSVLNQTHTDVECLVVDDGSRDATARVVGEIQRREPHRVRLLTHPANANRGVAASRNLALEHATGEFIGFLDADDAWLPHKLQRQLEVFDSVPARVGLVFSDAWFSRPRGGQTLANGERWQDSEFAELSQKFRGEPGSSAETLLFDPPNKFQNWVLSPTPLVRANLFRGGFRFIGPPRLNVQFEDYLMWLMLAFHCEFLGLDEPLAIYRVHEDQFVSRFNRECRPLHYLQGKEQLLVALAQECREQIRERVLGNRIRERFCSLIVQAAGKLPNTPGQPMRSIPLADYVPLLRLARRNGAFKSAMAALFQRNWMAFRRWVYNTSAYQSFKPLLQRVGLKRQ